MPDMLKEALRYAARGWHLVPLHSVDTRGPVPVCSCREGARCGKSSGKHPRIKEWQNNASSDPAQIREWWERWPDANIGLATCQEGSRLVGIDVDGPTGRASMSELQRTYEALPTTLQSISGREEGGAHIVFRVPEGKDMGPLQGRSGTVLGPGVDVRGQGGQIVIAPSMHYGGRRYRWLEEEQPVANLPTWLYVLLTTGQQPASPPRPAAPPRSYTGEISPWAQGALDDELAQLSGVTHRRHTAVYQAASRLGQLVGGGHLPEHLVRDLLHHTGLGMGLSDDSELARQIDNGLAWGVDNPRDPRDNHRTASGPPPYGRRVHRSPGGTQAPPTPPPPPDDDDPGHGGDDDSGGQDPDEEALLRLCGDAGLCTDPVAWLEQVSELVVRLYPRWGEVDVLTWRQRLTEAATEAGISHPARTIGHVLNAARGHHNSSHSKGLGDGAVLDVWADAPAMTEAQIPCGYVAGDRGVFRRHVKKGSGGSEEVVHIPVTNAPLLIEGRLVEVHTDQVYTRVSWECEGRWLSRVCGRKQISSSRDVVELAAWGAPVNSTTAAEVVRYLSAYESTNMDTMERRAVSGQIGWQGRPSEGAGFLWGQTWLPADSSQPIVEFHGADEGNQQLAEGYRARGSFERWRNLAVRVLTYPRASMVLYGAFVAPLLDILGAPNFILDLSFPTSRGKTTALRVGASVWGVPDENEPDAVLGTWSTTRVGVERASALRQGLPLMLDDTQRAIAQPEILGQMVYDVAQGRGKVRGSVSGLQRVSTWRTVLISSGEQPLINFTTEGGARARVVTVYGQTFPGVTGEWVNELREGIADNYGHAGRRMVEALLRGRTLWGEWRERYRTLTRRYQQQAAGDPVAGRLAGYFASIDLAGEIVHACGILPGSYNSPVETLFAELIQEVGQADAAQAAAQWVISWALGHSALLWDATEHKKLPDGRDWIGRWDNGKDELHLRTHVLRGALKRDGHNDAGIEALLRAWGERGWLRSSSGKGHRSVQRIDRQRGSVYTLLTDQIDPDAGVAVEADPSPI